MNGSRLRECRERQLLTQSQLAQKAGLTTATVSRLETGKTPHASFSTVRKLASGLGVEPQLLMKGKER